MDPRVRRLNRSFRIKYGLPPETIKDGKNFRAIPLQLQLPFFIPPLEKKVRIRELKMTSENLRKALNDPELIKSGQFSMKKFRDKLKVYLAIQQGRR